VATDTEERAMRFVDLMIDRVDMCKYPSKEMLDRIERALILFWQEEREDER
jgi:hypothetical protein